MTNSKGYTVVWLGNGDVEQLFPNQTTTYYSKAKQILKISHKDYPPIYSHSDMRQIWQKLDNKTRETVFANGRRETTPLSDHDEP
jgi:hypothetical protein